jgi:hypothetical protein
MLESKSKEIDGHTYEVTQLGAMRGLRLLTRIGAAVGPALAKFAGAADTGLGFDVGAAGDALVALFTKLDEKEIEHFVREMLFGGGLKKDGTPVTDKTFELVMAGQAFAVLKLLVFAFEVNYGDFSDAVRGMLPGAATAASPSPASTT